tara:strand:+ start:765 stop:1790 length:1026 start_codon:yes stop_codon:yes gene_type:complete
MAYTTVNKSTDYFNTKLYTGNNSTNAQTGVGFQPDFIWFKRRDSGAQHSLFDSARGVTKAVSSNLSDAQYTVSDALTSFDSDGFTLGADSNNYINLNSATYASWSWKAGTTSGISAGSQTITPSAYSINATAGMGIYKWSRTGASTTDYFSHGLGATPTIAIQKRTDAVQDWYVNTTIIDGTNDNLHLNKSDAKEDDSTTVSTSTNYYPKSPETGDYITYLFAPIKGFSKFGSYTGNGNTDGSFVYTGFKPAWLLLKRSDSADSWFMYDNKRSSFNVVEDYLTASGSGAEATTSAVNLDLLSNGFKIRNTDGGHNNSSGTYIYMAFGQSLVGSNNIPATAR